MTTTVQNQLADFVLKRKPLTALQLRSPWKWLHCGNARTGEGFAITGVLVPADGEHPGYRVMVEDMQLEAPQKQGLATTRAEVS